MKPVRPSFLQIEAVLLAIATVAAIFSTLANYGAWIWRLLH